MERRISIGKGFMAAFAGIGAVAGVISGCSGGSDTPPSTTVAAPPPSAPPASAAGGKVDGAALFAQNCAGCHGTKGKAGKRAPVLAGKTIAVAETTETVTNGKGRRMPAFKGRLTTEQIDAVAKYVATL